MALLPPPACPHIVCIVALGLAHLPWRAAALPHAARLVEAGRAWPSVPAPWQLARMAAFGYRTALIGGAAAGEGRGAQALGDEAAGFIAGQPGDAPFALSLALPCTRDRDALQAFDRAVGQVLMALQDWGHEARTEVLLGPVRQPAQQPQPLPHPASRWQDWREALPLPLPLPPRVLGSSAAPVVANAVLG